MPIEDRSALDQAEEAGEAGEVEGGGDHVAVTVIDDRAVTVPPTPLLQSTST